MVRVMRKDGVRIKSRTGGRVRSTANLFAGLVTPSHHNYSDTIHGLGQYYTLAAEGSQKERARKAIGALVSYWVDNDLKIAKYDKSLPMVPVLGLTNHKTLNTRVMMAIAGAKVAYHATGEEKFKQIYDQLVDQYGVRKLTTFSTGKDFDDAEHVFCHLDLLFRIEDDASLLAGYQQVADGLWCNHKDDAQSLFTYIYYAQKVKKRLLRKLCIPYRPFLPI